MFRISSWCCKTDTFSCQDNLQPRVSTWWPHEAQVLTCMAASFTIIAILAWMSWTSLKCLDSIWPSLDLYLLARSLNCLIFAFLSFTSDVGALLDMPSLLSDGELEGGLVLFVQISEPDPLREEVGRDDEEVEEEEEGGIWIDIPSPPKMRRELVVVRC